ncbi:MAG: hypothetical protein JNM00_14800, partial [Flavobacteriales bacterium]|nr:hypothetical protein [Flavobacteriales bacterium]
MKKESWAQGNGCGTYLPDPAGQPEAHPCCHTIEPLTAMLLKSGLVITLFLSLPLLSVAQQMTVNKTFDVTSMAYGNHGDIVRTSDDGYLLTAFSADSTTDTRRIIAIRVNSDGFQEWSTIFSNPGESYIHAFAVQCPDGGFLLATNYDTMGTNCAVLLIRLDASGNVLWTHSLGQGLDTVEVMDIASTANHVIVCGRHVEGAMDYMSVIYLDFDGNLIAWNRIVPDSIGLHTHGLCVCATPDAGCIAGGVCFGSGAAEQVLITSFSAAGNLQWSRRYETEMSNRPTA